MCICALVYGLIGTFGYLTFFSNSAGNILLNYSLDDPLIIAARIGMTPVCLFLFLTKERNSDGFCDLFQFPADGAPVHQYD